MDKYKIIVETDGDIGEYTTKPYLIESDFEELSSDYLPKDKLAPILLASLLMVRFLPKYYDYYHMNELVKFANKLFDKKSMRFKIVDDETMKKYIQKFECFNRILKKEENERFVFDIIRYNIEKANEFLKSNVSEEKFYSGNQTVIVIKEKILDGLRPLENAIVNVLKKEFGSELTYGECKDIAEKIVKEWNELKKARNNRRRNKKYKNNLKR